jgi:hypothetical protein
MIVADAVVHPYDLAPSNQITSAMRMHGLDAIEVAQRAHDEFSQARAQGVRAPWSALRGALSPSA